MMFEMVWIQAHKIWNRPYKELKNYKLQELGEGETIRDIEWSGREEWHDTLWTDKKKWYIVEFYNMALTKGG